MNPTPDKAQPTVVAGSRFLAEDRRIAQVLEEYLSEIEAGRVPDRQALLAAHPDIADHLAKCLDGLAFIDKARPHLQTSAYATTSLPEPAGEGTLGDYRLIREIGRGGMGIVYEARHLRLDRLVALKMIHFAKTAHYWQLARFRIEAEAVACLAHPNIIRIHEVGIHQAIPFVVLEFAPGGSLAQRICNQPQSPRWAAELVRILALALQHAHKRGILHRDLKPVNILLMADATPKISDFGLAKFSLPIGESKDFNATICMDPFADEMQRLAKEFLQNSRSEGVNETSVEQLAVQSLCQQKLDPFGPEMRARGSQAVEDFLEARRRQLASLSAEGSLTGGTSLLSSLLLCEGLTDDGIILGTPQYMAPEQASGRVHAIGPYTDIYSLGAVLYELLTGGPPFTGATREQIREQVLCQPPRRIRPLTSRSLETICLRCLEKRPEDRYGTASELADALQRFLDDVGASGATESWEPSAAEGDDSEPAQDVSTIDYSRFSSPDSVGKRSKRWWQLWK